MITEALVKAAAVGGIAMVWTTFTLKAIKTCKQIRFPPETLRFYLCEYCSYYFSSDYLPDRSGTYVCKHCAEKEVVCEECTERFLDDGEVLEQDKYLCKVCHPRTIEKK